jgi:serine phosphatase RsbU (regulator of sigma subunit)
VAPVVVVLTLYAINMVMWGNSPDFGWVTMYDSGPNVVARVLERGERAGLRPGDEIRAINGKAYSTFDELYFKIRNNEPGSVNTYTVVRDEEKLEISITTGRIGFNGVLSRSVPLFVIGLIYVGLGVLIFLMKPRAPESLLFLIMTSLIGINMSYSAPSDLMRPLWLFDVRLFINVFCTAPFVHLALIFPRKQNVLKKWPWLWTLPYLLSFIQYTLYVTTLEYYWDPAPLPDLIGKLLTIVFILVFLGAMFRNFFRDPSLIIRRQSQVILMGIALGFGIPTIDLTMRFFWGAYLFPDPTVGIVIFLFFFPLSIGYTIVKYDLFAIDALIKRTYGYVLTTGAIAGTYGLFVLISNLAFGRLAVTQSPIFPLIFVLLVVFFFNPVRNRVQKFVDRVFYRLEYDYQDTVQRISETMRSLLNLDEILNAMMDISLGSMYIDSGCVMLLNREKEAYECVAVAGERERGGEIEPESILPAAKEPAEDQKGEPTLPTVEGEDQETEIKDLRLSELKLPADEPLIQKIAERKKEVTVYDIEADPFFESEKESCENAFDRMQATLIVPVIYEDRLTGLISLGQKKSGKFYRRDDVSLLSTLASQGAVAIENAMLLEEVIEKERMEEELSIARDLQESMLPATCPEIEGFELAATSIPAREVGGDFFDFIEMGEDKVGLVIADVTGKSVSGALVMSASRSVFRMLSEEQMTVDEIMVRANRRTKKDIKSGMFVALLYAVLDAKDHSLNLCSAGQTLPIHLSAETGEAILMETKGDTFPLGILEEADYQETTLQLAPGDKVILYTDGIVEAMNKEEEIFGFERLLEVVQGAQSMSSEFLLREILGHVNEFADGVDQHDDLTVIAISVTG